MDRFIQGRIQNFFGGYNFFGRAVRKKRKTKCLYSFLLRFYESDKYFGKEGFKPPTPSLYMALDLYHNRQQLSGYCRQGRSRIFVREGIGYFSFFSKKGLQSHIIKLFKCIFVLFLRNRFKHLGGGIRGVVRIRVISGRWWPIYSS